MPRLGRTSKKTPIAGGYRNSGYSHTGIGYTRRTRTRSTMYRPFHELNGPVVVTKPADPEKLAAYRAQQPSKRRHHA